MPATVLDSVSQQISKSCLLQSELAEIARMITPDTRIIIACREVTSGTAKLSSGRMHRLS